VIYTVHGANNLDLAKNNWYTWVEKWLLTGIAYDGEISV
jgi:hypothetical protein